MEVELNESTAKMGLSLPYMSQLSSRSIASYMHSFSVLCFLAYKSACKDLSLNPSRKIEIRFASDGISSFGHLEIYCLSLLAQSLTISFSSYLNLVILALTLCLILVLVKDPMKSFSND